MKAEPVSFKLRFSDTDFHGESTIESFMNLAHEASLLQVRGMSGGEGWGKLRESGLTWIIMSQRIRFEPGLRPPGWQDEVTVASWRGGHEQGRIFDRMCEFTGRDGKRLATGLSRWLLVELSSRRPVNAPQALIEHYEREGELFLKDPFPYPSQVIPPSQYSRSRSIHVAASDMDQNQRCYNVRYLHWAQDSIDLEEQRQYRCVECEISYRSEAKAGMELLLRSHLFDTGARKVGMHQLQRAGENQIVARIGTLWEKR